MCFVVIKFQSLLFKTSPEEVLWLSYKLVLLFVTFCDISAKNIHEPKYIIKVGIYKYILTLTSDSTGNSKVCENEIIDCTEIVAGNGDNAATQIAIDFKRNIKNEIQSSHLVESRVVWVLRKRAG